MNSESKCVRDILIYIKLSLLYADSGSKKKKKERNPFWKTVGIISIGKI